MKKYSEYKDSGIPWIGKIPSHWEKICLKRVFSNRQIGAWGDDIGKESNNIVCLRIADFDYDNFSFKHNIEYTIRSYNDVEILNRILKKGDILIEKSGGGEKTPVGRVVIFNLDTTKALYANFLERLRCNREYNPNYVVFAWSIFYRKMIWKYIKQTTGLQNLDLSSLLRNESFYFPSPAEQKAIVAFLEKKNKQINDCICLRERELQTLNELKQVQIASVVTKGLDPNVPMKDSGIPWIGQIPAHWEVKRIKTILSESKKKTTDGTGTLLSLSQYTGVSLKTESEKKGMFEAESTEGYNIVQRGQFVMNIMLAWNGSYAVSDIDGIISPAYCVFDFVPSVDKMFYHYLWRTQAYQGAFKTMSKGIIDSRLRLYPVYFLAFKTIIPPIEEQKAIVSFIEDSTKNIDSYIIKLKKEIEHLKEYKQRLISDVVTGKIDVRDEA